MVETPFAYPYINISFLKRVHGLEKRAFYNAYESS